MGVGSCVAHPLFVVGSLVQDTRLSMVLWSCKVCRQGDDARDVPTVVTPSGPLVVSYPKGPPLLGL